MKPSRPDSGFTLVELLIIMGIIGVLSAIAIPTFMRYRVKAMQSEVRLNLKAILTMQSTYNIENCTYSSSIARLGWSPAGGETRYRYTIGGDFAGSPIPGGNPMNSAAPGAGTSDFTAVGWANIDSDPGIDTWQVTSTQPLTNVYDDVVQP